MASVAIYARYSSDLQSAASITDQVRNCRKLIESQDWLEAGIYRDDAINGASVLRPGYQQLLSDARSGSFEVAWRKPWTGCPATRRILLAFTSN